MSNELKNCPFCGSANVEVTTFVPEMEGEIDGEDILSKQYDVTCLDCGISSVSEDTEEAAIASWNTRPPKQYSELKPCPFCGSQDVDYAEAEDIDGSFVMCFECGTTSPVVDSKEKARDIWNRRAENG